MLIEFTVGNYGPFRDPVTLSMIPSALKDDTGSMMESNAVRQGILKAATVFGPNASGKSYLFEALRDLQILIGDARPDLATLHHVPFRLSEDSAGKPTEFGIKLLLDNIVYEYHILYVHDAIVSESLDYWPNGRRTQIFDRVDDTDRIVSEKMTKCTSYLYMSSLFNNTKCNTVLRGILDIKILFQGRDLDVEGSFELSKKDSELRRMMLSALDAADLGVIDFHGVDVLAQKHYANLFRKDSVEIHTEIRLVHDFEESDVDKVSKEFPLEIESHGTVEMFSLMGPVGYALKNGGTLIIDEFGSTLHSLLTRWIVGLFNTSENANGAQLIVNTHDLGLMDIRDLFRRDQIWFTNKDRKNGSCTLYSLSDIGGVKKNSDVCRDYLMGRYDAVPKVVGVRKL